MTVIPFPDDTSRVLKRAKKGGYTAACVGDLVCVCTDKVEDLWTFFSVSAVDAEGYICAVETLDGEPMAISLVKERDEVLVPPADRLGLGAWLVIGMSYPGLDGARGALAQWRAK